MTELEKCMAGEYYNCHDKIFLDFKQTSRELLKKYHELQYEQKHWYKRIRRPAFYLRLWEKYLFGKQRIN